MKTKKLIITLSLAILVSSVPSKSAFAVSSNLIDSLKPKTEITTNFSDFNFRSIDNPEANIPNESKVQGFNKENKVQVKSDVASGYEQTKEVAEQKASVLASDSYGGTSVQYALIDNGKIVLSGNAGVYSKDSDKALTADNMYGIGSVSKMFVTTSVMKLVDQGKVDLDAPVTKYIKDFKMADDRYKKITVRMLLNHSSGLMGTCYSNLALFNDNDTYGHDTLLSQLKTQRLKADPGAYSVYCNDGFTLAEILVERVTGDSYTKYIEKNITNPLKMNNTKTPMSKFDRDKLVKTYYTGISNALPVDDLNIIGAGGVYSSAEDLCKFATTFTDNSNKVLSNNSLKEMENKEYLKGIWPKGEDGDFSYGLGWDNVNLYPFNQYNIKGLEKFGDTHLYHSSLIVLPEKNMAMAIVSSGASSETDGIMAQEVLLAALKEKGDISNIIPDKTFTQPEKVAVPSELKQYEGMYAIGSAFYDVKIDESGTMNLSLSQFPQYGSTLIYTKDGTFKTSNGSQGFKFVKESNGKVYLQNLYYLNKKNLGQMAFNEYIGQKEEVNSIPENVSKAWAKRDGKKYYIVNEKYSSQIYMLSAPFTQINFIKGLEGYIFTDKIVDENTAVSILDGPGNSMSRDQMDYKFYNKDNHEYLASGGFIYVDESAISTLPTKDKFKCKIGKEGYAEWYKIGDESAGKEITVDMPKEAGFVVYDSSDKLVNDSVISGDNKVTLPKGGTIGFLGSAKAKFTVHYN